MQRRGDLKAALRNGVTLAALAVWTGCFQAVIEGHVVDVRGEALPGVAVTIADTGYTALSDALGRYRIRYKPGTFELELNKTGYTPGRILFEIDEARPVEAATAELWPLPASQGVYLFENFRYHETTRVEPRRFFMADGETAIATERGPRCVTDNPAPLIICYKTPRYDARLSRMRTEEAKRAAGQTELIDVWTDAGTIRPRLEPIDEAKGLLLELRVERPLEPGVYAVHWGSLEGYSALEQRMFMFEVTPTLTPLRAIRSVLFATGLAF